MRYKLIHEEIRNVVDFQDKTITDQFGRYMYRGLWADEDPIDPKQYLEETCKPKCVRPLREYQACVERIKGDETGHKHCTGQYFDYWSCIDNYVAQKLFDKLK